MSTEMRMARPAGIEPATPAFGGRETQSIDVRSRPGLSCKSLILKRSISIDIQPHPV